jgi:hypothetical protein
LIAILPEQAAADVWEGSMDKLGDKVADKLGDK